MSTAVIDPAITSPTAVAPSRIKNYYASGDEVRIPGWVVDFDSFRQWTLSADFPEHGRIDYVNDEIWADMTMEELLTHNQVKLEIGFALAGIVRATNLGMIIADRMRLVHQKSGLSCEPDLAFATWDTLKSKRLNLVTYDDGSVMQLEGTPDMTLEVISNSSVRKDTIDLMTQYAAAGIDEYWLVDARKRNIRFEINQLTGQSYSSHMTTDGWMKSGVFQREFRLVGSANPLGKPQFSLESR